ncbi:hypothetical protein SAMN05192553_109113 [Cyclobacterium xiamenense]|uniref:Lipoprotein n=1 Tax=Cyclobacterium xiamenense TaxID=1297121 RepID=A0A1H7BC22_9BACT|nr:hypothetical protein [Cyclobacterium xiamenense]SEJ71880.1 hypothetical protein SAMN05192553_109113 [Cyclobacterium xiamenense]
MMIKTLATLSVVFLLGACAVFQPRIPYQLGMSESKFLRQNKEAVISQLNENKKVYRLTNDDRFYILATFENGELVSLEEKELAPQWPRQRMMDEEYRYDDNTQDGQPDQ